MLETLNQVIILITGLAGLVSGAIGAFFAIRNAAKLVKEKSAKEIWNMIVTIADAAMTEAEKLIASGESKKKTVIDTVTAALASQGIDISQFASQLDTYIDECIKFANSINKKK